MLTKEQELEVKNVCQEMIDNMDLEDLRLCLEEDPEFSEDGLLTNDAFFEMESAPEEWDDEFTNDVIKCAYDYFKEKDILQEGLSDSEPGKWANYLVK